MKINEETLKLLLKRIGEMEARITDLESAQTSLSTHVANNFSQTTVSNIVVQIPEQPNGVPGWMR